MTKITGWYVAPDGETLEVEAIYTTNPKIVDLSAANLGLAVVNLQFFEDQTDALEQSKFNAEDTIAKCEERLAEMDKPKRRQVSSKPNFFRKPEKTDPLGPPQYGKGLTMANRKTGGEYEITGFRTDSDGVIYILKGVSTKSELRLNRAALDRQFEVVE